MFKIIAVTQLDHEREGGMRLIPASHWSNPRPEPISLDAESVQVWLSLVSIGKLTHTDQSRMLASLPPETRGPLLTALGLFAQAQCIEIDDNFRLRGDTQRKNLTLHKLHVELTHRCNFACKDCYLGSRLSRPNSPHPEEGTTEQWKSLFREARALGCTRVTVTGGEPFVRQDIVALLASLTELGIASEINTNASFITADTARKLRELHILNIAVSVYGSTTIEAAGYTGTGSAFQAAVSGVRNLLEASIPCSVKYFPNGSQTNVHAAVRSLSDHLGLPVSLACGESHGDIFSGLVPLRRRPTPSAPPVVQARDLPCFPSYNGVAIEPDGHVRACPKLSVGFGNAFQLGLSPIWLGSSDLDGFRTFWTQYCESTGRTKGAAVPSSCVASDLLKTTGGLQSFKNGWETWNSKRLM